MAQPAKAQEPTMEEILASIRRIIADDDATKPSGDAPKAVTTKPSAPPAPPTAPPLAAPPTAPRAEPDMAAMNQDDIDAMLAGIEKEPPKPSAVEAPDVFELTEEMVAPAPRPMAAEVPVFRKIEPNTDVVFAEEVAPLPAVAAVRPTPPPEAGEPQLISSRTSAAVDAAFNSLAQTVLVQNAKTLEDLVKEMLRPMLKGWLDDNLPTLVERLVRAEIERVSRGRG